MIIDSLGMPYFQDQDCIDALYQGNVEQCYQMRFADSADVQQFNNTAAEYHEVPLLTYSPLDIDVAQFDTICQESWFMPDEYKNYNLSDFLIQQLANNTGFAIDSAELAQTVQYRRVQEELAEYLNRDMLLLLCYMKYLVDVMQEHSIIWGVGRGSSVASYVLYLIGVHRVDSIQYELDWREFLR